jgi:signal transduction histidine kinase
MLAYVLFNITARTKSVSISLDQVFMILVVNAFPFVLIFMFSFLIKRQMMQRTIIEKTTKELEEKNKMLEKSYEALQEMAIIKERNRIAGEIHDTVGHTLTTVLIEIEASKRLIEKDKNLALEKLTLAQNQVKKGLNEIRSSVKKMSSENKKEDLKIFLEEIIQESEKHTDIKINKNISLYSKFDEKINNIIINALKEGITNGIKHGKATVFNFFIREDEKNIFFTLNNNGLGNIKTNLGFGLSNMKTKIEDIKGTININSQPDKGFTLTIKIPKNI